MWIEEEAEEDERGGGGQGGREKQGVLGDKEGRLGEEAVNDHKTVSSAVPYASLVS